MRPFRLKKILPQELIFNEKVICKKKALLFDLCIEISCFSLIITLQGNMLISNRKTCNFRC